MFRILMSIRYIIQFTDCVQHILQKCEKRPATEREQNMQWQIFGAKTNSSHTSAFHFTETRFHAMQ